MRYHTNPWTLYDFLLFRVKYSDTFCVSIVNLHFFSVHNCFFKIFMTVPYDMQIILSRLRKKSTRAISEIKGKDVLDLNIVRLSEVHQCLKAIVSATMNEKHENGFFKFFIQKFGTCASTKYYDIWEVGLLTKSRDWSMIES